MVEYLVEKHGIDALKQILADLGDGIPINDALTRNTGSIDKLDVEFAEYAHKDCGVVCSGGQSGPKMSLPEKPSFEELSDVGRTGIQTTFGVLLRWLA